MANIDYTPTEARILSVLSDGGRHSRDEIHACLNDNLSGPGTSRVHIHNLRKKLQALGEDIVCEMLFGRKRCYRHVRLLIPRDKPA
jgi:DNA-binding response OmpR family regulator